MRSEIFHVVGLVDRASQVLPPLQGDHCGVHNMICPPQVNSCGFGALFLLIQAMMGSGEGIPALVALRIFSHFSGIEGLLINRFDGKKRCE